MGLPQQRIEKQMINALMRLYVVLKIRIIYSILYFFQRFLLKLAVIGQLDDLIEESLLAVCQFSISFVLHLADGAIDLE